MKFIIFAGLLVVAASASFLKEQGIKFQDFKLKHGKTYMNQAEEAKRFNIFRDNVRAIEEHNALYEQGKVSYKKAINQFTDMTQEEFSAILALSASKKPTLKTVQYNKTGIEVPSSVDWRQKGQVTGVKNQGQCGSCWAFSVTGSTEAAYYRKHKKLVSLSEQQLVDCTTNVNAGCNGGQLDGTFPYIQQNGLESEATYPYRGTQGQCRYSASSVVTRVSKYTSIRQSDENALIEAVATQGPVSVAIDATNLSGYSSGIFEDRTCSVNRLNHGVLVVGYGSQNGHKYWIVKNSWGASWGEQGYFKLKRGENACGIAEDSVYPTIN